MRAAQASGAESPAMTAMKEQPAHPGGRGNPPPPQPDQVGAAVPRGRGGAAAVPVKLCGDEHEVRGVRATSARSGDAGAPRSRVGGQRAAHGYLTVQGPQRGGESCGEG